MTDHETPIRLSALVVARNEEDQLPECLASLKGEGGADEIVVVLDRSTDKSAYIARQAGATIIEGAWDIEGVRRNLGIESCSGDWIFEIDADERATPELLAELRRNMSRNREGYFQVPIRNHIGGREVRYGWGAYNGNNSAIRLFTKGAKIWGSQRVHPKLQLGTKLGRLKNGIIHYVDRDITDMFDRFNRYSTLMAEDAVENDTVPGVFTVIRRMFSRSWRVYVRRKGYKEGIYGVALAFFSGNLTLAIYLKARELRSKR